MAKQYDIVIIGGGLTGCALLLALANQGFKILLIDNNRLHDKASADFDARTLALSPASISILQMLNLWPLINQDATPINHIHVSERGCFGSVRLESKEQNALGFVVPIAQINQALHQLLNPVDILAPAQLIALNKENSSVTIKTKTETLEISAKLIVAADGTHSTVRQLSGLTVNIKNYPQQALIANVGLARSHHNWAYERFTSHGPLAMLPMQGDRVSLIWSLPPAEAECKAAMAEQLFLAELQQVFGYKLGRFTKVGKRTIYPLQKVTMPVQTAWPLVFIGNAAHTLHPVAGQGFNLGLRDVAALAECIVKHGLNETMLNSYQAMRRYDQRATFFFTELLTELFTSRRPGVKPLRNAGLIAVDSITGLQKLLTRHARGFAGISPDLVCGIELPLKRLNEPTV